MQLQLPITETFRSCLKTTKGTNEIRDRHKIQMK